ncbi:MAG: sensor histidine kinase [Bacteroidetes bacterium]|nr:sensor histidine kinase [Bacteroidota bacterium]
MILACNNKKESINTSQVYDKVFKLLEMSNSDTVVENKRAEYIDKALLIIESIDKNRNSNKYLFEAALGYYKLKEDAKFNKAIVSLLNKAKNENDSVYVAKAYNLLGNQHINLANNDSAYYYILKSEKMFYRLRDSLSLGKNYIDKAFVQLYENDFSGCELSSIQALNYLKKYNEVQKEYDAYNLIGICSNESKNYENALIYHNKALSLVYKYPSIKKSKAHYESSSLNNIGYVYQNMNRYEDAINNYRKALFDRDLLKESPYIYSTVIDNLAYSKFKLNQNSELPGLFFEALNIRIKNQMYSGTILSKIHLSEFFSKINDTINAKKYAVEALSDSKKTKVSGDFLLSLKQLSSIDHQNSSKYSKEYIRISDSLQIEERKAKDKFARIAFETDEIIQEKDKLAEQNRSLLYFFVGTLFVGLLLFVIRTQRAKNRELLLKQQQQKANEEIYNLMISQQATIEENRVREKKRIAQELHDGVLGRLFGARLNLDSLNRSSDEESINSRFNYLNELKNIEQDIREISHDLNREKHALINNFVAIVHNLLDEQSNSFEPVLTFSIDEKIKWESIGNNTKINLYRILQESLQNINKYAQAKHIHVEFKTDGNLLTLKVTDDGVGFEVDTKKRGIGLQNMLSRTSESEGSFEVQSKKGKGTTITVSVPLIKNEIEA